MSHAIRLMSRAAAWGLGISLLAGTVACTGEAEDANEPATSSSSPIVEAAEQGGGCFVAWVCVYRTPTTGICVGGYEWRLTRDGVNADIVCESSLNQ